MLGKRIQELRKKNKISRKELADKLNISYSTLSNYESGTREPNNSILLKISDYFNVSTDYLLGKTDIPISLNELNMIDDLKIHTDDELIKKYGRIDFDDNITDLSEREIKMLLKVIRTLAKEAEEDN